MSIQKIIKNGILCAACIIATPAFGQEAGLFGAISPGSRSVQIGQEATAFATMINSSTVDAANCKLSQSGSSLGAFSFQQTDPLTNTPVGVLNAPVNIPAGGSQSFVFSIAPNVAVNGTNLALAFSCDGFSDAPVFAGVNTLTLSASSFAVPDVIAIAATLNSDQIVDIAGTNRFAGYGAAAINIGADGNFNVVAEYTGTDGPVQTLLCETNAATGACLATPAQNVQSAISSGNISTYSVFLLRQGDVQFRPATNRVRLRFTDNSSLIAGQTGIATRGTGTDLVIGSVVKTNNGFDVNGVSFTTGAASYTRVLRAGVPISADALVDGQRAKVVGSASSGEADTIEIDGELIKGPVTNIGADRLEVVGQTVLVGDDTVFQDRMLSDLQVGDFVEVNGVFDSTGLINASLIDYIPGGLASAEKITVKGTVANHNPNVKSFTLQNLNVNYPNARVDDDFAGGVFADGDLVEVKSIVDLNGLTMTASKIEPAGPADGGRVGEPGFEVEIEGFISRFASATSFAIDGQAVATNANTVFRRGTAADLALNVKVEVEGVIDDSNVLQANKVTLKAARIIRLEGPVDSVDLAAQLVTVLGVPISVGGSLSIEDNSTNGSASYGVNDIAAGQWLQIRGSKRGDVILANEIRRDDVENRVSLQGTVDAFDGATLSLAIIGVDIQATASTVYKDSADLVIGADVFFAGLSLNDIRSLVKAKGSFSGGILTASELSLEPED